MDFTSYDLVARANILLDSDDKVRRFLMETTRVIKVLSDCDALNYRERRALKWNYYIFIVRCNLTPGINRRTAGKVYSRFVGGYCEGLTSETAGMIAGLFDELIASIAAGETVKEQQAILDAVINDFYKF